MRGRMALPRRLPAAEPRILLAMGGAQRNPWKQCGRECGRVERPIENAARSSSATPWRGQNAGGAIELRRVDTPPNRATRFIMRWNGMRP